MQSIKVLDVTLRDGGCVNNFNFGSLYMNKILKAQEESGIDIIELGYIDENKGTLEERTQYINEKAINSAILKQKKKGIEYVAMIDYGKYHIERLEDRNVKGIDGIRLAFHKEDIDEALEACVKIKEKGYKLYIQPMVSMRYNDDEFVNLVENVNEKLSDAEAFYIVDSFGEMRKEDVIKKLNLVDRYLSSNIKIGFHSHNNLQLSYSNAVEVLNVLSDRDLIIDSSIMGMGKGAGNLNTELWLEYLNLVYNKHYDIGPLLEIIDKVINPIRSECYWGYAPEYYLSAINHCSPTYASYFYNKHMLPMDCVGELLTRISNEKKKSFDAQYAENIYAKYNREKIVDDTEVINELKAKLKGKTILIIAPGKSIIEIPNLIKKIKENDNVVTISLNNNLYKSDYVIVTRKEKFDEYYEQENLITTSNIYKNMRGRVTILNYDRWIDCGEIIHDSAGVISLNLANYCEVSKVLLVGFDGFSIDINSNYYDYSMRHTVNRKSIESDNKFLRDFIYKKRNNGMEIEFLTDSIYET